MVLAIIAFLDKLIENIVGPIIGFIIRRSDISKKKKDEAQAEMDQAAKEGNYNAYWNARSRRNRA